MTNKSYGQKSPGYQPEESCKKGACTPPNTSPAEFINHECDMVHIACTPVCFKGKFYIAKEGATGDPDAAANKENWLGSFDYIDGMFWKAMMECASPSVADSNTTYTLVDNPNGTQNLVGSDGTSVPINQSIPIPDTDQTCVVQPAAGPNGSTILENVCFNKSGIEISREEFFRVEAGAIDTVNLIRESATDPNCMEWIRPDLTVVPMYKKDYIDDLECRLCEWTFPSNNDVQGDGSNNPTLLDWGYTTEGEIIGGGTGFTAWQGVLPAGSTAPSPGTPNDVGPWITKEETITRAQLEEMGMPSCHNTVLLSVRTNAEVNGVEGDGQGEGSQIVTIAKGCNQISGGDDLQSLDEAGTIESNVREHYPITLDPVTDSITVWQQVNYSSPADRYERARVRSVVKLYGSKYSKCGSD